MLTESFVFNTWTYPLFYFAFDFTANIWPISAIIYSLMYMITHQKNIMELENIERVSRNVRETPLDEEDRDTF